MFIFKICTFCKLHCIFVQYIDCNGDCPCMKSLRNLRLAQRIHGGKFLQVTKVI